MRALQVAVQRTDGTPYRGFRNRQVHVTITQKRSGGTTKAIIPDDAIVRIEVMPEEDDTKIMIQVSEDFV